MNNTTLILNNLSGEELLSIAVVKLANELVQKLLKDQFDTHTYLLFKIVIGIRNEKINTICNRYAIQEKDLVLFLKTGNVNKYSTNDSNKIKDKLCQYLTGKRKPAFLLFSDSEIKKIEKIKSQKNSKYVQNAVQDFPMNTEEYYDNSIKSITVNLAKEMYW